MKRIYLLLLAILTGFLLVFSWPARGLPFIILFAFIPLLFVESFFVQHKIKIKLYFLFSYIAFLIFNLLTTWWLAYATLFGAVFAVFFNSLFMASIFTLFHATKRYTNKYFGYFSLIIYWITFEYLHLNWDLSWSWLNLGNAFARFPEVIQWYEYTGCLGGTLWILLVNILLFRCIEIYILKEKTNKPSFATTATAVILLFPIIISFLIYSNYTEISKPVNITIVQPNIDPYNEKFGGLSLDVQLGKMLALADKSTDKNTELIVCPETAISDAVFENKLYEEASIFSIRDFIQRYPNLNILIGMSSYRIYPNGINKSETAKKFKRNNDWYDDYNAGLLMTHDASVRIYHKSKLVPGVEKIPFPYIFKHLEKYAIDLGGTTGSLGVQKDRTALEIKSSDIKLASIICYESIYGEYVTGFILNGANLLCIITNDGWWKDTPGYKQHFQYARLRAVETRRSVARSANTGISGFINQRGDVLASSSWWRPASLKNSLNLNNSLTFYVKHGDYIGKIALICNALLILLFIFKKYNK